MRSFTILALVSCLIAVCLSAFCPLALPRAAHATEGVKEKVILDTDMVEAFDDGVAMLMLVNAPNIEVLGVTVVSGNSWVQEGVAYTLHQLALVGKGNIPVYQGMEYPFRPQRHENFGFERLSMGMGHDAWLGSFGRPQPENWEAFYKEHYQADPSLTPAKGHAVSFIIDTVRAHPGEVTICAIGPCSNLAAAIRLAPDIIPLIKRVVYMGGAFFQPGNVTPTAEFNWWFDPEAARMTVRAPFREQVVFGLDVCEKVVFRQEHYARLRETLGDSPIAKLLRSTFVGEMMEKDEDFTHFVWDTIVAAALIDPSLVTGAVTQRIDVNDQLGASYGESLAFPKAAPPGAQSAKIVTDIDTEKFWNMVNDKKIWGLER